MAWLMIKVRRCKVCYNCRQQFTHWHGWWSKSTPCLSKRLHHNCIKGWIHRWVSITKTKTADWIINRIRSNNETAMGWRQMTEIPIHERQMHDQGWEGQMLQVYSCRVLTAWDLLHGNYCMGITAWMGLTALWDLLLEVWLRVKVYGNLPHAGTDGNGGSITHQENHPHPSTLKSAGFSPTHRCCVDWLH